MPFGRVSRRLLARQCDIAAENVLLTDTIESILGGIDLHFSTTFTAIDQLLALINTIENKASVLLSDLNQLPGANTYLGNFAFNTNAVGSPSSY